MDAFEFCVICRQIGGDHTPDCSAYLMQLEDQKECYNCPVCKRSGVFKVEHYSTCPTIPVSKRERNRMAKNEGAVARLQARMDEKRGLSLDDYCDIAIELSEIREYSDGARLRPATQADFDIYLKYRNPNREECFLCGIACKRLYCCTCYPRVIGTPFDYGYPQGYIATDCSERVMNSPLVFEEDVTISSTPPVPEHVPDGPNTSVFPKSASKRRRRRKRTMELDSTTHESTCVINVTSVRSNDDLTILVDSTSIQPDPFPLLDDDLVFTNGYRTSCGTKRSRVDRGYCPAALTSNQGERSLVNSWPSHVYATIMVVTRIWVVNVTLFRLLLYGSFVGRASAGLIWLESHPGKEPSRRVLDTSEPTSVM